MALNLSTTELSSIFIGSSEALGKDSLNEKFKLLKRNDINLNQLFSNLIGIWQCYWYYDSSINGYSIGDVVWLNTEDKNEFVKSHATTIKKYTDLNSQILNKLPEFDEFDDDIITQYANAMSGYTNDDLGSNVVLPPIYDIGDISKPIQLLVSLKNNNKSLLSDKSAWKPYFVNSDEDEKTIRQIININETNTLENHILKYHLSGYEDKVNKELSNYFDNPLSTQNYNNLSSNLYNVYLENKKEPTYGVDYVRYSIRKPYLSSGNVSQYQAVRYWNSGMIEHFGTIATDNELFISDSGEYLVIPFNWEIANDKSGAKLYYSGELGDSFYNILSTLENSENLIGKQDNFINIVFEQKNVEVDGLKTARIFANSNYNITVTGIYQNQEGIDNNYIPIEYGSSNSISQKWNSNYLTNERLDRTNRYYFSMKKNSRILPPYISYYAVGKGDF